MDALHSLACPCGETLFDLSEHEPGDVLRCPACGRVTTVPDPSAATTEMEAPRPTRRSQMSRRERVALSGSVLEMNEEQFDQFAQGKSGLLIAGYRIYRRLGLKGLVIIWNALLVVGFGIWYVWKLTHGYKENLPSIGKLLLVIVVSALVAVVAWAGHTFIMHKLSQRAAARGETGGRQSGRRSSARRSSRVSAASSARRAAEKESPEAAKDPDALRRDAQDAQDTIENREDE